MADMLAGVIRLPYERAMGDEISRRQFYDRAQQALDERDAFADAAIEAQAERDAAREERDALNERVAELEAALRECLSMPTHRYQGDCPGPGYPALRDPECPACQVMVRAAALVTGKETAPA